MPKINPATFVAMVALLAASACNDGQVASAPIVPPPLPGASLGTWMGTVDANTKTVTFTPVSTGSLSGLPGGVNAAIYGSTATVSLSGIVDTIPAVAPVSNLYSIRVTVHNLFTDRAIGSNYGGNSTTVTDTSGITVFFTTLPVQTLPVCGGCTVTINNNTGTASITAPNQKYFWYFSRVPQAVGPGVNDSTPYVRWRFTASSTSSHAFTFFVELKAAWPAGIDGPITQSWAASDSLPNTNASPRWKFFASTGQNTTGAVSWSTNRMRTQPANLTQSDYFSRHDSIAGMAMIMDAGVGITTVAAGAIQAVIGFTDPQAGGGRQAFVGIASDRVGFVTFTQATGLWAFGPSTYLVNTTPNTTTVRLFRTAAGLASLCVNSISTGLTQTYAASQATQNDFAGTSIVYGSPGRTGGANARWVSVVYNIAPTGTLTC